MVILKDFSLKSVWPKSHCKGKVAKTISRCKFEKFWDCCCCCNQTERNMINMCPAGASSNVSHDAVLSTSQPLLYKVLWKWCTCSFVITLWTSNLRRVNLKFCQTWEINNRKHFECSTSLQWWSNELAVVFWMTLMLQEGQCHWKITRGQDNPPRTQHPKISKKKLNKLLERMIRLQSQNELASSMCHFE